MAEDFFGDITEQPKDDFFGDIKPAESDQRGIVARTTEGFKGAYHPMLEGAIDKVAGENFKTEHPYLYGGAKALLDANPLSWLDKAITGVTAGVAGAAPGAGAGLAEAGGMSKANADRLQRDLGIVGQGIMVEPGMGLAAARAPQAIRPTARAPAEAPAAPTPVVPAEQAPARPRTAEPLYDAITGERVDNLPEIARSELPPETAAPNVDSRATPPLEGEVIAPGRKGEFDQQPWTAEDGNPWGMSDADYAVWREQPENRAAVEQWERDNKIIQGEGAKPAQKAIDYFADITEEPPTRVTERIPDEAVDERPAGTAVPNVDSRPIYRGYGRAERGAPYNQAAGSAQTPILGEGRYFSFNKDTAREFGPQMEEARAGDVAKNPLVITDGQQWRALTREAGWDTPNPFGRDRATFDKDVARLRSIIEQRGHDGVAIEWDTTNPLDVGPNGENLKLLRNTFGEPQVVAFSKGAKAPPEAAAPYIDSRPTKPIKEKPPETLSSYIARNGGLELTPEARDMGLHKRFIPGAGNVARKNGRSLDKFWRERLAESGYIDRDPDGGIQRDIRGELYEKLGGSEPAYSKFDRPPELKVDPRSADIERQARIIEDAFEKEGLSKADLDTGHLYDAAERLYRGEATDPFEAYDRAVMERENAQSGRMRGASEEVYPAGEQGAGSGIEEAFAGRRQVEQGTGSVGRVPGEKVRKSQAMSRVYEPGAEGKPQLVLPGAERLTAAEVAKRKVAESLAARQKQEKITGKVPQKPMDEGLFGEGFKQEDLFAQPAKKPDQSLIQRQEIERGRSGRPTKTKPIPIGTEEAILERGYEKTTGPKGEPREPGIAPAMRKRILRSYKEMLQPELISEDALRTEPMVAKRASVRAQAHDQILREGAKRDKLWNKIPEKRQIEFMGAVERGQPVAPEFRGIARLYRGMLDQAYTLEKQWGSKAGYVGDYFPHLWERPEPGQLPIKDYMEARIQALGQTWFQKARTFDLIEEGLAAGYKLRSTNPERLMTMRLMSGADMRANMQLLNEMRGIDMAIKVKETNRNADQLARAGWQKIHASDREQWMIAPDVQALWKNGVEAKGLWANEGLTGDFFRAWMGLKNVWIPIKLALSAFHPLHVAGINLAHHWAQAIDQMMAGHVGGALMSIGRGVSPYQGIGKRARAAWVMGESARTPEGKLAVKTMNEGGFSPMLSEQLRIDAGRKFSDAIRAGNPLKMGYHGMRFGIQKAQSFIFEHWIPHLKAAAYLNDAAAVLKRNPELLNDPVKRGVALRAIAKSVDNRFGEMFYGALFWNRTAKDMAIGSFLSLGWNLGFVREFGGAAMETLTRPASLIKKPSETRQIIRDSTNKIKFAGIYFGTSALMGAAITYAFTGEEPKDATDYIFPRAGGVNPDGSPRRFTTMSYLREGPMWAKHVQEQGGGLGGAGWGTLEMIYNKMLFQPVVELVKNRNYFGAEIMDTNAPGYTQFMQALKHIGSQQLSPMSVTGAQRARETGGTKTEEYMAYLGFGPAPAYAERSAIQNRITHLYQRSFAPEARPYEEEETSHARMTARAKVLMAKQKGDPDEIKAARAEGLKAGLSVTYMNELGKISTDQRMFRRLGEKHQMAILGMATEQERERYWPYANKKTREKWNAEHGPKFAEGGAVYARDKAAADAMLPAPGRALEDRLNKGAWESRFGRYGSAPESGNIEDLRTDSQKAEDNRTLYGYNVRRGFKRGGDSGTV